MVQLNPIAEDVRRIGTATVRISRLTRAANSQLMQQLSPLHDQLSMTPAVHKAEEEAPHWLASVCEHGSTDPEHCALCLSYV